ncbi:hypothetical protein PENSPDRAFT_594398 [Peniophora sp. CONT]|nr:hypothetical protein PENSPDRAFT_594398 [Peniophora sp. CONT]
MSASNNTAPRFEKFKVSSWSAWETNMSALLRSKGLMGRATGLRPAPLVPKSTDTKKTLYIVQSNKEHCAGEIILWLKPKEQAHVRDAVSSPQTMWELLKKCHVQERAISRFNVYDNIFSICLKERESLTDLAVHVKEACPLCRSTVPSRSAD